MDVTDTSLGSAFYLKQELAKYLADTTNVQAEFHVDSIFHQYGLLESPLCDWADTVVLSSKIRDSSYTSTTSNPCDFSVTEKMLRSKSGVILGTVLDSSNDCGTDGNWRKSTFICKTTAWIFTTGDMSSYNRMSTNALNLAIEFKRTADSTVVWNNQTPQSIVSRIVRKSELLAQFGVEPSAVDSANAVVAYVPSIMALSGTAKDSLFQVALALVPSNHHAFCTYPDSVQLQKSIFFSSNNGACVVNTTILTLAGDILETGKDTCSSWSAAQNQAPDNFSCKSGYTNIQDVKYKTTEENGIPTNHFFDVGSINFKVGY